jgi:hypothetical protein
LTLTATTTANSNKKIELVAKHLATRIKMPEARSFINIQKTVLTNQNQLLEHCFRLLLSKTQSKKQQILKEAAKHPMILKKLYWAEHHCNLPTLSLAKCIVAIIAIDGIFSVTALATTHWIGTKSYDMLPGLHRSYALMSRDTGLNCIFCCKLTKLLKQTVTPYKIHRIIDAAVKIEQDFCNAALTTTLEGIN